MKNYYIVGAGGFAKEVLFLTKSVLDEEYEFKGFIDREPVQDSIKIGEGNFRVLDQNDFLEQVNPSGSVDVYFGIGDPKLIEKLSKVFQNYSFPNLIHNNVVFDKGSVKFGRGNIVTAGCVFTTDIIVGSFNIFNLCITVGHDCRISNCNVLNPNTNISGESKIGSRNLFGTSSTMLQSLKVGNDNVIGASALLNRDVNDDSIMVGVPAKRIK